MSNPKAFTKDELIAVFKERDAKDGALSTSKNLAVAFDVTEDDAREIAATVYLLTVNKEVMTKGVVVRKVREAYITKQKQQGLALFLLGSLMAPPAVVVGVPVPVVPDFGPQIGEAS